MTSCCFAHYGIVIRNRDVGCADRHCGQTDNHCGQRYKNDETGETAPSLGPMNPLRKLRERKVVRLPSLVNGGQHKLDKYNGTEQSSSLTVRLLETCANTCADDATLQQVAQVMYIHFTNPRWKAKEEGEFKRFKTRFDQRLSKSNLINNWPDMESKYHDVMIR